VITRFRRSPSFVLALFAACLLIICAFIVFEVLDLDGSDFPRPTRAVWSQANSPDPPRDLKRAQPHGLVPVALDAPLRLVERTHALSRSRRAPTPIASTFTSDGRRHDPATLPRASLSEDFSSAA
jgi:hypothetical protein